MKRREFLKSLSLIGGLSLLDFNHISHLLTSRGSMKWVILSSKPDNDIKNLINSISRDMKYEVRGNFIESGQDILRYESFVEISPPNSQDITLIIDGKVVDPLKSDVSGLNVRALITDIRIRKQPSKWIASVYITPEFGLGFLNRLMRDNSYVEFYSESGMMERVKVNRDYRSIEIAGALGKSVFAIENRRVRAVKSPCRNKNCIDMGWKRWGEIICAPNRVYVELPNRGAVDGITG